ncbi:MAG: DUF3027 domain-containing protein [Carbonactinosporaceae bacterium]
MGDNRRVTSTTPVRTPPRTRRADRFCAEAVELALAAAEDVAGIGNVGDHLAVEAEDERVVTHHFACRDPAYRGWRWAVTVARAPRARFATVSETVLLPGTGALLAPAWVPWSDRLRPGDLGAGDLLPAQEDDERLAYGDSGSDAEALADEPPEAVRYELGLGRTRVLSRFGRDAAAERWYAGPGGPHAAIAKSAPADCATCGFFIPITGPLRRAFGVCANEFSPSDGQVVARAHGCGAHSEATVMPTTPELAPPIIDEFGYDVIAVPGDHPSESAGVPSEEPGPA